MGDYIHYPRGFKTRKSDDSRVSLIGDVEINRLYDTWRNTRTDLGWEFTKDVVKAANRLMPNLQTFISIQRQNSSVSEYGRHALYEMGYFIITGKHNSIHPMSFRAIVESESSGEFKGMQYQNDVERLLLDNRIVNDHYSNYIGNWIGHYNGLEDIICTLYLLFGGE